MSQNFRSRYSEMRANDPTVPTGHPNVETSAGNDQYAIYSNVRNIDFMWPDGHRKFLNYSYLIGCDYLPDSASIVLEFTTHTITLKGIRLASLYEDLFDQIPRYIVCVDARYNVLSDSGSIVNEIIVTKNA